MPGALLVFLEMSSCGGSLLRQQTLGERDAVRLGVSRIVTQRRVASQEVLDEPLQQCRSTRSPMIPPCRPIESISGIPVSPSATSTGRVLEGP